MKYKIGDEVKIKSKEEIRSILEIDEFRDDFKNYNRIGKIKEFAEHNHNYYWIDIDEQSYFMSDKCFTLVDKIKAELILKEI